MASTIRLELSADGPEMQDGLQARIHDPLWLLGRQWQFGEFKGQDVGSPAAAEVVLESAPITRYRPGPPSGSAGAQPYSPSALPLETLVEREPMVPGDIPKWRMAVQAGLHLFRLLNTEGAGTLRPLFLKSRYLLKAPPPGPRQALDEESARFLDLFGKRVADGVSLYARLAPLRTRGTLAAFFEESPFATIAAPRGLPGTTPSFLR
jgi:hypothetical protein